MAVLVAVGAASAASASSCPHHGSSGRHGSVVEAGHGAAAHRVDGTLTDRGDPGSGGGSTSGCACLGDCTPSPSLHAVAPVEALLDRVGPVGRPAAPGVHVWEGRRAFLVPLPLGPPSLPV